MLKVFERHITLQLLVFYGFFVLPLLLGGVELYFFQRDSWQRTTQQADLGLAQSIAQTIGNNLQTTTEEARFLASLPHTRQLDRGQLITILEAAQLTHPEDIRYLICDPQNKMQFIYPIQQEDGRGGRAGGSALPVDQCNRHASLQAVLSSKQPLISTTGTSDPVVSVATAIVGPTGYAIGTFSIDISLVHLISQLRTIDQQFTNNDEVGILISNATGQVLASSLANVPKHDLQEILPGVQRPLNITVGNHVLNTSSGSWLYSAASVEHTTWMVAILRQSGITLTPVISFQHSLIIALIMLIVGASFFWFAMHGWVVAPLSRLEQAVARIRPNQATRVTDHKLIAKERNRQDEIGRLITAISTMEDEIHTLFEKSDEQSQARLHTLDAIMRSMDEGVLLEDPNGQLVYANDRFIQLIGLSPQELLDHSANHSIEEKLLNMIEDVDAYRESLARVVEESDIQVVEFQVHGSSLDSSRQVKQFVPGKRDMQMRLFLVRDALGQVIGRGKIFYDVTRHNEAERVKKNLLAIVSHELRTPLTAIKGYATSLLATDVEIEHAVQERFLRSIVEEDDRMAELVTNLLEMSQVEAGTLKLRPELYQARLLLEQVVGADKREHIRLQIADAMPLLYVDRRRLEMVLRNLLDNAWCYAGPDATVEIVMRHDDQGLHVTITDDGPGLPPHQTERIFDHFYQIDSGRKRSKGGVGLGLAICRGFVEAHGGRIWAENRTDGVTGACFCIWLPPRVLYIPTQQKPHLLDLPHAL